jgi:hypothetical protein
MLNYTFEQTIEYIEKTMKDIVFKEYITYEIVPLDKYFFSVRININ